MADTASAASAAPWTAAGRRGRRRAAAQASPGAGSCPSSARCVLFIVWDLVVRFGFIKPILLPTPCGHARRAGHRPGRRAAAAPTSRVTVKRTLQAFLIAAVVGVPLGVLLGSNERAYRSVEFLIDFFRSTPSSALIPLFLLIFGVSDINKVAIAAFGALPDRASSTAPTASSTRASSA